MIFDSTDDVIAGIKIAWKSVFQEEPDVETEEYIEREVTDPQTSPLLMYAINRSYAIAERRGLMPDGRWYSDWPTEIYVSFGGHGDTPPDVDIVEGPIGASWTNAIARLIAHIAEERSTDAVADWNMDREYHEYNPAEFESILT